MNEVPARPPCAVDVDAVARVVVLGVPLINVTKEEAAQLLECWIDDGKGRARAVFIVNAHTLNLACDDHGFREVLRAGDAVFGDGTGVRWAARMKGVAMRDNLVGTDLLPYCFTRSQREVRVFLLGSTAETVRRAAVHLEETYARVRVAGAHHGYLDAVESSAVVRQINAARPDMLLVAMGNPLQEQWIHEQRARLEVPVSIGVGGLFDHWGGNLRRAPTWVRRLGFEWLQLMLQQPQKARRYLAGNPRFVARALRDARENGA
ncbi:MAG: WecB/TagA/CpsF family glycosyltransferase [Candidatus Binatia bacterium]